MSELIKISLTFAIILILLRKKLNIGYVMLIASSILFVLYSMNITSIAVTIKNTLSSDITIKLLLALSLIRMFELILREQNVLSIMMSTAKVFFKSKRAVIISMPMLIGMLPSIGGAYFSAPMVKEATAGLKMSQEEKAFVNYWFRHPWEYILPLYPGILLASAIAYIPLYNLIIANLAYALVLIAAGFMYSMRGLQNKAASVKTVSGLKIKKTVHVKREWASFLPIFTVLILVVVVRIELHYALLLITIPLLVHYKYSVKDILRVTRHGFAWNVIVLLAGVMLFKETMETSGAVGNLSRSFLEQGIPALPILCLLPFLTGLLTGLTVGFVGSTFPLLVNLGSGASLADISLAFAAGYIGVLLSPVHLCLVLTKEYFRADIWGIYKKTIPASAFIFIVALIEYMIFML
jgi:integral membrane protein (TIGR00529 family)